MAVVNWSKGSSRHRENYFEDVVRLCILRVNDVIYISESLIIVQGRCSLLKLPTGANHVGLVLNFTCLTRCCYASRYIRNK